MLDRIAVAQRIQPEERNGQDEHSHGSSRIISNTHPEEDLNIQMTGRRAGRRLRRIISFGGDQYIALEMRNSDCSWDSFLIIAHNLIPRLELCDQVVTMPCSDL